VTVFEVALPFIYHVYSHIRLITTRRWTWRSLKQLAYRPGFYQKVSRRALMSRGVTGKWSAHCSGPNSLPLIRLYTAHVNIVEWAAHRVGRRSALILTILDYWLYSV